METQPTFSLVLTFSIALIMLQSCLGQNSRMYYLLAHDAARAQVGVGSMAWDATLENYARTYVNQRVEDCNLVPSPNNSYGENLAKGSENFSGIAAVNQWASERKYYNYSSNSCVGGECGSYTQVVWNTSVRLGCARARCSNGWWFISCNYGPRGNLFDERPYLSSSPKV